MAREEDSEDGMQGHNSQPYLRHGLGRKDPQVTHQRLGARVRALSQAVDGYAVRPDEACIVPCVCDAKRQALPQAMPQAMPQATLRCALEQHRRPLT